jgi:hypothetical protein
MYIYTLKREHGTHQCVSHKLLCECLSVFHAECIEILLRHAPTAHVIVGDQTMVAEEPWYSLRTVEITTVDHGFMLHNTVYPQKSYAIAALIPLLQPGVRVVDNSNSHAPSLDAAEPFAGTSSRLELFRLNNLEVRSCSCEVRMPYLMFCFSFVGLHCPPRALRGDHRGCVSVGVWVCICVSCRSLEHSLGATGPPSKMGSKLAGQRSQIPTQTFVAVTRWTA